ncbi:MAG: LCCL domain-containing protein [Gemmataceae bacterium]|nr:LCCL domain-containing protein [Gemmataceae bacterium]MDW8243321.1 LCCL domain-containing protein [Thermogemmata sp.]
MPRTWHRAGVVCAVTMAAGVAVWNIGQGWAAQPPAGGTEGSGKAPAAGVEVEVRCCDNSVLRVRLLEDKLELQTRYGTLSIPAADIRRIEFAPRIPPADAERIALAISRLAHPDYQIRERASAELLGFRERAYPFLLRAMKSDNPEVSRRAEEAVRAIQSQVPAAWLESREYDVIQTDDCKITGRLTTSALRVHTAQFGEQLLRLSDVRVLSAGGGSTELTTAPPAPSNLMAFQHQFGKELSYTLTGYTPGTGQANVWGTDVYTLDSHLAAAAVHAGVVQPGKTTVVHVRIVQSPPQFIASYRNGINSTAYGHYPAGAYEFVRK